MYLLTPKKQAILVALIAAVLSFVASISLTIIETGYYYAVSVFVALLLFLLIYLSVSQTLNKFFYKKLTPIYKTIYSTNFSEEKIKSDIEEYDDNFAKEIKKDVLQWAKMKSREISQLRNMEKYRREFLGNVSHELKTPLFNIQGYISTLLDGGLEDDTINTLYLERTDKSVNRLISVVNDLESISRLESGESILNITVFNIVKLIEDTIDIYELKAEKNNIKIILKNLADKKILVEADQQRIEEVLSNLINNSIKYGVNGGQANIEIEEFKKNILVKISDNGIGINQKDIPRIFERFFRADKSRSRQMGGTGLGLAIVKHIIEAHNQTISVKSMINKGSEFSFTLKRIKN